MNAPTLLVVHPDASIRGLLNSMLQTLGHRIEEASSDPAAVRWLEQSSADAVIAVANPADPDALELLAYVRRKHPRTAFVLLWTGPHAERTREALQWGAASVLRFPLPANHLRAAVAQALGAGEPGVTTITTPRIAAVSSGSIAARDATQTATVLVPAAGSIASPARPAPASTAGAVPISAPGVLIGSDSRLRRALDLALAIAPTPAPILILGERGTGKTLLARAVIGPASRAAVPFLTVDCSAPGAAQLELELFGGSTPEGEHPGRIAQARGGTLVLDEVAALPPALQVRLARLLQDKEYEPAGSAQTRTAEVRFLFTSREDLQALVEAGPFRYDLYYRMSAVTIALPPLRQRGEDIERLADHFRARFGRAIGKATSGFSGEALEALRRHPWPGNVLELANVVERAVVACRGERIEPAHLELDRVESAPSPAHPIAACHRHHAKVPIQPLKEALEGPERQLILQALEALNWNRQETARVLDINRTTLYKKMKKYGLLFDEPAWVN